MSYNGQMNFGLLGDYDALPDIDAIGESIRSELASLLARAAAVRGGSSNGDDPAHAGSERDAAAQTL